MVSRAGAARLLMWLVVAVLATSSVLTARLPARAAESLQLLDVGTQHWVGRGQLLFEVFEADDRPIVGDDVTVGLTLMGPAGEKIAGLVAQPERYAVAGRSLYAAEAELPSVGEWQVRAHVAWPGGSGTGTTSLTVRPDDGTPPLGSLVPGAATPTLRDAGNLMASISSDPEPVSAFYTSSVDQSLANRQPFVFAMDSYAYRPNEACGGALGVLHDIYFEFPALTIIHAEPWRTAFREGALSLDPPGGPAVLTDWATDWGLEEPPWVFVVSGEGRLVAKFSGIFGTDELRAAMASVSPWHPLG